MARSSKKLRLDVVLLGSTWTGRRRRFLLRRGRRHAVEECRRTIIPGGVRICRNVSGHGFIATGCSWRKALFLPRRLCPPKSSRVGPGIEMLVCCPGSRRLGRWVGCRCTSSSLLRMLSSLGIEFEPAGRIRIGVHVLKSPKCIRSLLRLINFLPRLLRRRLCVACISLSAGRGRRLEIRPLRELCFRRRGISSGRTRIGGIVRSTCSTGGGRPIELAISSTKSFCIILQPRLRITQYLMRRLDRLKLRVEFDFPSRVAIRMIFQRWIRAN